MGSPEAIIKLLADTGQYDTAIDRAIAKQNALGVAAKRSLPSIDLGGREAQAQAGMLNVLDEQEQATQRLVLAEIEAARATTEAAGAQEVFAGASKKTESALRGLAGAFGRGSEAALLMKTLMGGGAVMALKLMADGFERLGNAVETAAKQLREGKLTISEAVEKLNDVHPVAGPAYRGLSSLKRAVTGEQSKEDYAAEVEAEYQRLNKAYEHAEEIHKAALVAAQKAEDDSAEAFAKAVDEKYKALNDEYERLEQIHRDGLQAEQKVRDEAGDKAKAKEREAADAAQQAWDDYWRGRTEATYQHEREIAKAEEAAERERIHARETLESEARSIHLEFQDPTEKMNERIKKLWDLAKQHLITGAEAERGIEQARADARGTASAKPWGGVESAMATFDRISNAAATFGADDAKATARNTAKLMEIEEQARIDAERQHQGHMAKIDEQTRTLRSAGGLQ